MKRRNLLISLKPVKSGLVQEIPRELVVSESGMIWRLVAVSGGTVGGGGGGESKHAMKLYAKRHCMASWHHDNLMCNLCRFSQL